MSIAVLGLGVPAPWAHDASAAEPSAAPSIFQTWTTFTTGDGLPDNRIRDVQIDGGRVWVATDGGLACLVDSKWKTWTQADGLPRAAISSIAVDPRTHDVWFGSLGSGLLRLSGGRVDRFDQFNSGLAGDLVFSVAVEGTRVWAATNAGVSTYDATNDSWDLHLERRTDAPEIAVTKLFRAGRYLYAQSWCDRIRRLDLREDARAFVELPGRDFGKETEHSLSPATQPILAAASAGETLYWATRTEVFRRRADGGADVRPITPDRETGSFVHCMTARGDDEVWIGTDDALLIGLNWRDDTSVTYAPRRAGRAPSVTVHRGAQRVRTLDRMATLPDSRIRCITLDGNDIWVGTANGLARGTGRRRWEDAHAAVTPEPVDEADTPIDSAKNDAPPRPKRTQRYAGDSVTIGCLVPVARTVTLPPAAARPIKARSAPDLFAVQLAIQQANDRGGYSEGIPFKLAVRNAGYPAYAWGTLEDDFPLYQNEYGATAMLTSLVPGNRIAAATALAMEMPIVNVTGESAAVDERTHPWMYRCSRTDPSYHAAILDYLVDELGVTRMGIVRTGDGEEHAHLDFWRQHAKKIGHPIDVDVTWKPNDTGEGLAILEAAELDAVLTWSDARNSAMLRAAMRNRGMTQWFVGSDRIVTDASLASVRFAPDRVIAAFPCPHVLSPDTQSEPAGHQKRQARPVRRFEDQYLSQNTRARRKGKLSSNAYLSFDAAEHLIHAIRLTGRQAVSSDLQSGSADVPAGVARLSPGAIRKTLRAMNTPSIARLLDGEWHRVALPGR